MTFHYAYKCGSRWQVRRDIARPNTAIEDDPGEVIFDFLSDAHSADTISRRMNMDPWWMKP